MAVALFDIVEPEKVRVRMTLIMDIEHWRDVRSKLAELGGSSHGAREISEMIEEMERTIHRDIPDKEGE